MADPIKLYLDEDAMRASIVRALQARQIDVTTALDAHLIGRPDTDQLAYTSAEGRVLFSFNRGDFAQLHRDYLQACVEKASISFATVFELLPKMLTCWPKLDLTP